MCPSMTAHWRYLANTIEFVHLLAHSSPQSKRQMHRFSRFCTAQGRKCLYFTMCGPIYQSCPPPFPLGELDPHLTRFRGPMPAQNPNGTSIGSAVFAQTTTQCPYTWQWFSRFPSKLHLAMAWCGRQCNTWFLEPTQVQQTVTRQLQPFSRAHWCDRLTDRPRYSAGINGPHVHMQYCDAA